MYLPGRNKNSNYQIPVIMEFGTLNTRVGFVGHDCPRAIIPSDYAQKDEDLIGLDWFSHRLPEQAEMNKLIKNGQIQDWDMAGKFIKNIMQNVLYTDIKDVPLFMVEPPLQNRESRIKIVDLIFEECGFSSVYMHKGPILSSYIFAKENMLLVDSGADGTYVIPIQEGFINQKALMRTSIGGEFLTNQFSHVLNQKIPIKGAHKNFDNLNPSMKQWSQMELVRELKHQQCKLLEFEIEHLKFNNAVDTVIQELPDGNKIELGREVYAVPELMYQKIPDHNFQGLQHLVKQVIEKVEFEARKELIQNVIIVGGNSMTFQFEQRLQKEIYECDIFGLQNKCKTYTPPNVQEKLYSAWLGASIVGSMGTFDSMLMTKKDYEEHGSILIERKILV